VAFEIEDAPPLELVLTQDMPELNVEGEAMTLTVTLSPPVTIMNSEEAAAYLRTQLPLENPLGVTLDGFETSEEGYSVEVNTPLNYQVEAQRGGHLLALHLGSDNVLTLIYPSPRGSTPQLAEAGSISLGQELDLMATEPLGREWMVFVVVDELPSAPVVRGAQPAGDWGLRFPFGGKDSPGRDIVLWLAEMVDKSTASSALIQVEVVYRLSES